MDKVERIVVKHVLGMPRTRYTYYSITGEPQLIDNPAAKHEDIYLIYLTLKTGALDKKEYDVIREEINGYYEARMFYSPKQETPNTKPDLRTTIHWEPNIATNEKGEATISYYNADPKTKIRIVVEGITENGMPVVGNAAYEVK